MLTYIFAILGVVFLAAYFILKKKSQPKQEQVKPIIEDLKKNLGEIQVFYASQTGTAAKMASMFAEEAQQHGFSGVVIDLKNISHSEFQKNQISIFFMANTGEGEPPENAVIFMKMLGGKQELEGDKPSWNNMSYAVFGLGDTQYEHFNKIGIDTDKGLEKLGAQRIHKIALGDANSSLEDDYEEWKSEIWPVLVSFREAHPFNKEHVQAPIQIHRAEQMKQIKYLDASKPVFANFRFFILSEKPQEKTIPQSDLDFKTKASLLGKPSKVQNIIQRRQDTKNGSSLQLQIVLADQPEYPTAGNIALWPLSDPQIVHQILNYFKIDGDLILDIDIIDKNKKNKFNFVAPVTAREILETYLDLQFRITKGLLKKLSKFTSKSPEYFLTNSSAKTTEQYKRLSSENQFSYLFKLIKQYSIEMCFEDFVELSDSVGPRLFTIASSWKAQKNVVVIASLVENGLISKHFERNPDRIKAELRKSSFGEIYNGKWKKVIFIGAGTGFAPFRGYLQEKNLLQKQGVQAPIISLYFGCKYSNSDFIYKEQILAWQESQTIEKLSLAFSRQGEKKVYVQNLLESNQEELKEFIHSEEQAIYICGSLGMGKDVSRVIEMALEREGKTEKEAKEVMTEWEKKGKIVKELW